MPLTIANIDVDYLGGPTNFALLTPNVKKMSKILDKDYSTISSFSLLCLLGDNHNGYFETCKSLDACEEDKTKCISMLTPTFYRLLDTLCLPLYHIDYFLETPLFSRFFKYHLLDKESANRVFAISDTSVLAYISKYNSQCFLKGANKVCFTKNIQYHMCELRMDDSLLYLPKNVINIIRRMNHLMKTTNKTMNEIQSMAEDESVPLKVDASENNHFPMFESYLYSCMTRCLSDEKLLFGKQILFFDMDMSDLLKLLLENPKEWIHTIVNHPKFILTSYLWKQCLNAPFTLKESMELFKRYFLFCMKKCPISEHVKNKILEGLNMTEIQRLKKLYSEMDYQHAIKASFQMENIGEIKTIIGNFSKACMMPFNDMAFFMRSHRINNHNSILSVYHAGYVHTKLLREFLCEEEMLYDEIAAEGFSLDDQCYPLQRKFDFETFSFQQKRLIRCVDFSERNIPTFTYCYERFPNLHSSLKNYKDMLNKRVEIFGMSLYLEMLSGRMLSEEELLESIRHVIGKDKEYKTVEECKKSLGIKQQNMFE
jgi:hypothetical protein